MRACRRPSTRAPRRSLRPCARSRRRPKTTRPCANGSSGTAWARCRACGRSCASTRAGRPPWNRCCANACTRSSFPRLPGCSRFLPIGHQRKRAVSGALADWLAGAYAAEKSPDAARRAALPPGAMLVDRDGHQFTRHTVSFHAPDQADAGLLARQSAIEALDAGCRDLQQKVGAAQDAHRQLESEAAERSQALEQARRVIAETQKEQHDAQIDQLKLAQAQERYRERSEQVRAELSEIEQEASRGRQALQDGRQAAERIAAEIATLREKLEAVRGGHLAAETALAEQRRAVQQAERGAQDALFGERECASKIAEIDNSVRVIDQQIERADLELAKLTEELAADPIPAVRHGLDAAVESRLGCETTLAAARNAVEGAASALRELEEARLQIEAKLAPLRERLGDLRLT